MFLLFNLFLLDLGISQFNLFLLHFLQVLKISNHLFLFCRWFDQILWIKILKGGINLAIDSFLLQTKIIISSLEVSYLHHIIIDTLLLFIHILWWDIFHDIFDPTLFFLCNQRRRNIWCTKKKKKTKKLFKLCGINDQSCWWRTHKIWISFKVEGMDAGHDWIIPVNNK